MEKYKLNPYTIYVKISSVAASTTGTLAFLKRNDEVRLIDLLHGLMLPSGNDAAIALSEAIGILLYLEESDKFYKLKNIMRIPSTIKKKGEECLTHEEKISKFLKEMNKLSCERGLEKTNFASVHGLITCKNISTAKDMAVLSCFIMNISLVRDIVKTKLYTAFIRTKDKLTKEYTLREESWKNTNKLLDKGYEGIKTGVTDAAGPCLASSFKKEKSG